MVTTKQMIIIEVEGLDKSGKFTQSNLLTDFLRSKGYKVEQSEFHRYDTPTGQLIQKWLYKEWDVDKHTIELVMSADKQSQQKWFEQLEKDGVDFLILDRYIGSQVNYATASGLDSDWIKTLQSKLRKPDLSIFLDIAPEESMRRKGKHGENDRYESDRDFLSKVRTAYYDYFNAEPNRVIFKNIDKLSVEEISELINTEIIERYIQ